MLDEPLPPPLFHKQSMSLILSQSFNLMCDPVAAVLKSATSTHTAAGLENFGEVAITVPLCLPVLLGWTCCCSIVTVGYSPRFRQLLLHLNSK